MPFGADNALVKAAEVVRRLAAYRSQAHIGAAWKAQVGAMSLPDEIKAALVDPARVGRAIAALAPRLASRPPDTHTTFSPNVVHGGQKTNIIPDLVELEVDIRTVPGTTQDDVAPPPRRGAASWPITSRSVGSRPTMPVNPPVATRCGTCSAASQLAYPGAELIPGLIVGGTDARFFRQKGAVAYGTGLSLAAGDTRAFVGALSRQRRADRCRVAGADHAAWLETCELFLG